MERSQDPTSLPVEVFFSLQYNVGHKKTNCMDALKALLPGPAHLAFHNASNRKLGMRLCIKPSNWQGLSL